MTKTEFIKRFSDDAGISQQRAKAFVEAFFDSLSSTLADGNRVELRHFGNFSVRDYDSYTGRNPKSGEKVVVGRKRLPYFKVSISLRDRLNKA